jgi:hypothetical protein
MFGAIFDILKKYESLNENELIRDALADKGIQQKVLSYNYYDQLFLKGIDSEGASLGRYTAKTVEIKKEKGQPTDRVTLKDTGKFYASFTFVQNDDNFVITADTIKDKDDLTEMYTPDILGLTDESIDKLIPEVKSNFIDATRKALLG